MLPTKLLVNYQKNLHKHAHSMATGQTGRNCAQMHCTTASGTLTSEQQQNRKRKAFRRSSEMQTAGPEGVAWAEAFKQVVRYCAENNKEITITDLCEKLKEYLNGDTPYTEKYMRMKLESHFGEDVILTGIRGKRNVVTSRSTAEKILERFLKSAMEKDGREKNEAYK